MARCAVCRSGGGPATHLVGSYGCLNELLCQMGSTFKSTPHSIVLRIKWSDACWEQCVAYSLEELKSQDSTAPAGCRHSCRREPRPALLSLWAYGWPLLIKQWWNFSLLTLNTLNTLNSNPLNPSVYLHNSFPQQSSHLALFVINCILASFSQLYSGKCIQDMDTRHNFSRISRHSHDGCGV